MQLPAIEREAIHRRAVMKEGKLLDEHMFALLKEDWKKKNDNY